ncbi:F-box only protein 36b [Xyrichtys novacula]|uniref:F-box only protein 36b n=1 Tax=Xyrichtys novacula TaxID=13765 RepID=A0AAV1GFH3_XYRNO|nr:F-box only protein 36b [Xyrichtys novacula]
MASLLTDPLFEISGEGPPPNKTYYYFSVTKSLVIWRWWKISMRTVDRYSRPGQLKESHMDFLDDTQLQSEVRNVFGHQILQYTKALCQGHYDYLERLSDSLLLFIISYLDLEDVGHLGRTSRRFRKLCGSEEFWEQTVRRNSNTVSAEVASLAAEVGWCSIFFTSKLQLQKLLSRRRAKSKEDQEEQISDPDTKVLESLDESSAKDLIAGPDPDSQPGIIPDPSSGTKTGTDFDTSSCCDADPNPCPDPDAGSELSLPLSCQLFQDIKKCLKETQGLNDVLGDEERGDHSAVTDKEPK